MLGAPGEQSSSVPVKQSPKEIKPKEGENDLWYSQEKVIKVLDDIVGNRHSIRVLAPINILQGTILADTITDLRVQEGFQLSRDEKPPRTYLIPINIAGLHWTALYFTFPTENRDKPTVRYFDPYGDSEGAVNVRPQILAAFREYMDLEENDLFICPMQLQWDDYNCGPWMLTIFEFLIEEGQLPPENIDVHAKRNEYDRIYERGVIEYSRHLVKASSWSSSSSSTSPLLKVSQENMSTRPLTFVTSPDNNKKVDKGITLKIESNNQSSLSDDSRIPTPPPLVERISESQGKSTASSSSSSVQHGVRENNRQVFLDQIKAGVTLRSVPKEEKRPALDPFQEALRNALMKNRAQLTGKAFSSKHQAKSSALSTISSSSGSSSLTTSGRSVTTPSKVSSGSSSTTSQSSALTSTIHTVKLAEHKQELVNFQEKVKSLLSDDYKFSISRPEMSTLIVQCTSINEVPGAPETIEEKLSDLIQSLKSAIAEKDIKSDQYEMDIEVEEGKLAIKVKEPKILNRIAELLEKAGRPQGSKGVSYFTPPSQVKEALFGSRKSASVSSSTSEPEPVSVNCLLQ
ncbi:MAG: hypothetical protein JSR33_13885, partial [Proteobacteria bacterium]|nr:hypothetical protein [Pseudomonadota bacterium]